MLDQTYKSVFPYPFVFVTPRDIDTITIGMAEIRCVYIYSIQLFVHVQQQIYTSYLEDDLIKI